MKFTLHTKSQDCEAFGECAMIADEIKPHNIRFPSGVWFARSTGCLVNSLFNPGGTASGHFKVRKNGINFYRGNGEPWFFLVANKHGERFFVTCGQQSDGRTVYMHSLTSRDESALGLPSKLSEEHAIASRIWTEVNA